MFFVFLLLLLIPVLFTIFQGIFPIAFYIMFFIITFPFLLAMIWGVMFYVEVSSDNFLIRRGFGLKYSFNVMEIKKVIYKIRQTNMGTSKVIWIFVNRRKIVISNLMENSDKMDKYIQKYVPKDKIIVINK